MVVPDGWPVKGYFALLRHTREKLWKERWIEPGHASVEIRSMLAFIIRAHKHMARLSILVYSRFK
jgi:hypothetical protein